MKKRKSIAFEEKSSLIPTCLFYARQTGPELKNGGSPDPAQPLFTLKLHKNRFSLAWVRLVKQTNATGRKSQAAYSISEASYNVSKPADDVSETTYDAYKHC
jgi:hypothetical protein